MRSAAVRRSWGTGKLEARPDQALRRPLSAALHVAVRELGHPNVTENAHVLGVLKAFATREERGAKPDKLRDRWQAGIDAPLVSGRADSGDIEISATSAAWLQTPGAASRSFSTRCRTSTTRTSPHSARPATRSPSNACHW
jgi:hypothetical protein